MPSLYGMEAHVRLYCAWVALRVSSHSEFCERAAASSPTPPTQALVHVRCQYTIAQGALLDSSTDWKDRAVHTALACQ
jgi:hypothetical protein